MLTGSKTFGQTDTALKRQADAISIPARNINDTVSLFQADTIVRNDTLNLNLPGEAKKSAINSKVEYSATDSISLDLENQKVYMYRDADIKYEKIKQKAAYIIIDFNSSILTAMPRTDSVGKKYGMPEFSEGDQAFKSEEMRYNFRTRKGFIKSVITQEGEGYLHGDVVKKMENDISNMRGGGFTTCDLEHPHFALRFTKAKVIPGNKIVTGPAYMTIEDVPIPIVLPFGLFPNKKGQVSGILVPTYGESRDRGFYLENGGYYFGISEYMELKLLGDIWSRGSWAVKPQFNYRKRYKFNGSVNLGYSINTSGIRETSTFKKIKGYTIKWTHAQDPKARPNSRFNANVNIVSQKFNEYNPVSREDLLTNQFQSSISYSTSFAGKVNLTTTLNHRQNTSTRVVDLTLPSVSLSVNRMFPLRKPGKTSDLKWYENISMGYTMDARNEVSTYDSLMFTNSMLRGFRSGMQHNIPVSVNLKVLKYFTLTPNITYSEKWYSATINKVWVNDTLVTITNNDTITKVGYVRTDTIGGFKTARDYSFSSALSTKLYGMIQFRKGPIRAIRHVITPSVNFSYKPDFGRPELGYYRTVQSDTLGNFSRYSVFGDNVTYRPVFPYTSDAESGRIGFNISNNLEMKVRSKSDTVTGTKKVVLIEQMSLATSYDLTKDSLKWSILSLSVRTTLFKKIQVAYNATFDPYIKDDKGRSLNQFEWDVNRKLFRRDNSTWNLSMQYSLSPGKDKGGGTQKSVIVPEAEAEGMVNTPDSYINWNNPWNFSFNYNLSYNDTRMYPSRQMQHKLIQTLGFNGDVNVTPKWKVNFNSGYDFIQNKLSYTSVSIYRDLHCWEMRFNWIPMGTQKSWNFYIKVKAGILQDLKLNRKKDFRDN